MTLPVDLIEPLSLFGTAVFALTGAISAAKKRFDIFGMIVLAAIVGLGGGTLRDILLGRLPVAWVSQPWDLLITTSVALFSFFFLQSLYRLRTVFLWADALGLATFAVVGASVALEKNISPFLAPVFGMFTACFGGLLRDVIANERPLILYGELYASAALAGAAVYTLALSLAWSSFWSALLALAVALVLRALGIIWRVHLPRPKLPERF
jgi:uncharacterized membrane protein YeiH